MNVYIINNNVTYDITKVSSNLSWRYEMDTLAGELSLEIASGQFGVGDMVVLKNGNKEIYRGIIVSEDGKTTKSLRCMDLGWYLNKNELTVQFKKSTVHNAILHLTNKFGIPTELPDNLKSVTISKLYKDMGVGDIIRDLLDFATLTTNNKYYLRMFGGVLAIRTLHREAIKIYGVGTDFSIGKSIEEMYNKVVIISDSEKDTKVYAEEKDDTNISKYGLLQIIESVSAEDKSKARNIAKNKLKELNKVEEDLQISCIGNYDIVAGRRVLIHNEELKGEYLVKEVTHNYTNEMNYFCDLTLERWGA